ncbi:hypothetical protein J3356_003865 [Escherichia coli]|uniref:hypothetical protein n=1 Tax=Escherichia coli TaxID=562 RepID=UPI00079FED8F|nr:hypothetical protein [Escherichia coli]HDQ6720072.1 hypothetical protein [Escherichia coli O146:H21]EEC8907066.1 hypothetical protein [Escherichia coli]EEQ6693832.1 hypothetical protein [Escherichia coli]EEQ8094313.1 hypothetical protein [Escherichia coli]EER6267296.1 hypothetical protein [Escherichia coli]
MQDTQHNSEGMQLALLVNREFWSTYDPEDKSTAPSSREVIDFLVSRGASKNLAVSIDKVVRPASMKAGGRPRKWR